MTEARITGNAPAAFGTKVFNGCAAGFSIYYLEGKIRWTTPTWNGYPAQPYTAVVDWTLM